MQHQTMRQFTLASSIVGAAIFLGTPVVVALGGLGVLTTSLKSVSASLMFLTLALQFAFIMAQLSQAGRSAVPLKLLGPDAWPFVLVATGMPGVFWHNLASYAGYPANLVMPGFVTPLVTAVLFMGGREIQQRTARNRNGRSHASVG